MTKRVSVIIFISMLVVGLSSISGFAQSGELEVSGALSVDASYTNVKTTVTETDATGEEKEFTTND